MQLYEHYRYLSERIGEPDLHIAQAVRSDEAASRLLTVPGIGPSAASLSAAEAGNARQ